MKAKLLALSLVLGLSPLAQAGEYWIRPDGTDGTGDGSAGNPWVRTTATSFDTLINGSTIPTASTVHLMAGIFHTVDGIQPKAYWKLRGAGIDVTTVRLNSLDGVSNVRDTNGFSIISPLVYRIDGVEVSDLTVDCNLQATTGFPLVLSAVAFGGDNARISRVKAINWGSTSDRECFVLGLYGNSSVGVMTNCVIEDCIIGPPAPVTHTQGATTIVLVGNADGNPSYALNPGAGWIVNGEIRNCFISRIYPGTSGHPTYCAGVSATAVFGFKATGNRVFDMAGTAIGFSCGSMYNFVIENNFCIDVGLGISFTGSDACGSTNFIRRDISIINNFVKVRTGGYAGIVASSYDPNASPDSRATNFMVSGNYVEATGGSFAVSFHNLDRATFEDNVIDGTSGFNGLGLIYDGTTFGTIRNNHSSAGLNIEPVGDQQMVFVPSQGPGWYRLLQSYNAGFSSGNIRVTRDQASDNTTTDIDFDFSVVGYISDPEAVGTINVTRCLNYLPGSVEKVRIGNLGAQVYLDIYVATAPTGVPITIKTSGGNHHDYAPNPYFVGTTNMPSPSRVLVLAKRGLQTSEYLVAGTNNIILNDSGGKILSSALNIVDPAHGALGLDASGWAANLLPYTTGTGAFGSATISAYGRTLIAGTDAPTVRTTLGISLGADVQAKIAKTADQTFGTTLTSVNDLSFPVSANQDYGFEFYIVATTTAGTEGYQLALSGPGTPTELTTLFEEPSGNTSVSVVCNITAYGTVALVTNAPGARFLAKISGTIRNGATGGTVNVQARSESSGTGLTVKKASWGHYWKL